ncbi:CDP-glycerol glycerophosphotransferase family protein [uncultured Jatrophihabitans sp.]|uniref:bifunctional glycosyltransferase/CDP-glycerol:glycerophosphate glycerophosphotransferase n=1 Tax=uncultured Jatrophihabitans sp. TaxID=1610747 RepID=UPI0035CBB89D
MRLSKNDARAAGPPRFSIISAVHDVGRYLDQYIASIEGQSYPLDNVEVIVVDDGSTDNSLEMLERWQRLRPDLVTVLTKSNGGQASARNLGFERATGEWVTFTDPDDWLAKDYLSEIDAFISENPSAVMAVGRRVVVDEASGEQSRHPLDSHFTKRNRLRNLDLDTGHFHGSAPSAFFRRTELRRQALVFDERLKPSFEDGYYCCSYLLQVEKPIVGFVRRASYFYRKRADQSSTLDTSWVDPERYTCVPRYGYLRLLEHARDVRGNIPPWIQGMVLYELSWYFKNEDAFPGVATAAHGSVAREFNSTLAQIAALLDPGIVRSYSARRLTTTHRDILLHSFDEAPWHTQYYVIDKVDFAQRLMRLRYRYTGEESPVSYVVDGESTRPVHAKVRDLVYFDRVAVRESVNWLPLGTIRMSIGGGDLEGRLSEPAPPDDRLDSWAIRQNYDWGLQRRVAKSQKVSLTLADRVLLRVARSKVVGLVFGRAWVLIDRVHNADDNAEHLFRYIVDQGREVNAWFVIEGGVPDHRRLCREGYRRRVVKYGTLRWKLLMLNADNLISSHVDAPIVAPPEIVRLRPPAWRFTFLQHGVIKDDISRWINTKDIDTMVASTRSEYNSLVGEGTPYLLTHREVVLTGLPRFDRLRERDLACPDEQRTLLLFAPTWRAWLIAPKPSGVHRRVVDVDRLFESQFLRSWTQLVTDDRLRRLAASHGLTIALLLHPDLQSVRESLTLPQHVELLQFEGQDVQTLFVRARVFVTDYSSMAFNAAYVDRPQVYYQFDRDRFFAGGHAGRAGYFDYFRDGFGPVAQSVDDAVAAIASAVESGPRSAEPYRSRIRTAFPERDGRCSERTFEAIKAAARPAAASGPVVATSLRPASLR